jgi:hypothetical protein
VQNNIDDDFEDFHAVYYTDRLCESIIKDEERGRREGDAGMGALKIHGKEVYYVLIKTSIDMGDQ